MKSRIKVTEPKLISYGFNEIVYSKLETICKKLGVQMITCKDADIKISDILKGNSYNTVEDMENSCIVMCDFTEKLLDEFLSELRKSKTDIPLKSVITPHNSSMTVMELVRELKLEYDKLNSGN